MTRFKRKLQTQLRFRRPEATSLGPVVYGYVPPFPCTNDVGNWIEGAAKRVAKDIPLGFEDPDYSRSPWPADPKTRKRLRRFREFVRCFLRSHVRQLSADEVRDFTFEDWLLTTGYNGQRKQQLREARAAVLEAGGLTHADDVNKSHGKPEFYDEFKFLRTINSRTDNFKAMWGPLCKLVEKVVYEIESPNGKYFVKHVPVMDRGEFLDSRFPSGGQLVFCTDHSNFEQHFTRRFMEACEKQLYSWVLGPAMKSDPTVCHTMRHVLSALNGKNVLKAHGVSLSVEATRMSGDMNTSLGNGFSNLMIMLFLCSEIGVKVDGIVEGDDGLFVADPAAKDLTRDDAEVSFRSMGFEIKCDVVSSVREAGFCRMYFYPDGDRTMTVVDPISTLAKLGWTASAEKMSKKPAVRQGLLVSKVLSMLYCSPGCPILAPFASHVLQALRGVSPVADSTSKWWDHEWATLTPAQKAFALSRQVSPAGRDAMERIYHIPPADQVELERYLCSADVSKPLVHPLLDHYCGMHKDWAVMWNLYVD